MYIGRGLTTNGTWDAFDDLLGNADPSSRITKRNRGSRAAEDYLAEVFDLSSEAVVGWE
jgi:hypothetical protein